MATSTTRMALTKPSGSASPAEAVDVGVLNTNADLLDKFIPCILVNDGVTPATGDLYDGALVKEKTSGKIWEARKNGGGTFDKVWVRYPYNVLASNTTATSIASSTSGTPVSLTWRSGKNSSSGDVNGSFKWVVPIKGLWILTFNISWANNATNYRSLSVELNGAAQTPFDEYEDVRAGSAFSNRAYTRLCWTQELASGDIMTPVGWQNSGGNLNREFGGLRATLIEPIQ